MATRQFTGKTVDEATDLALETLKLKREEVEIVVVNPGRSGILGFGGEPAVIRVTPLTAPEPSATGEHEAPEQPSERRRSTGNGRRGRRSAGGGGEASSPSETRSRRASAVTEESPAKVEAVSAQTAGEVATAFAVPEATAEAEHAEEAEETEAAATVIRAGEETETEEAPEERQPGPDPEVEACATEIVDRFLGALGVVANTYIREDAPGGTIAFDIEGEDAGLLIGRRGETLQALQFLVNLMVNKELGRQAYVTIDVEGYRDRRHESLRTLAMRTASRVASSGRQFALQPMSAGERRIVHLTLAEHPSVRTESRGEGEQRRVVVLPKR